MGARYAVSFVQRPFSLPYPISFNAKSHINNFIYSQVYEVIYKITFKMEEHMGRKSQIKAQRRAENIAKVQRQRDLEELHNLMVLPDIYAGEPIINIGNIANNYSSDKIWDDGNINEWEVRESLDIRVPFETFWICWNLAGLGMFFINIMDASNVPDLKPHYQCFLCWFRDKTQDYIFTPFYLYFVELEDGTRKLTSEDWSELHKQWEAVPGVALTLPDLLINPLCYALHTMNISNVELVDTPPNPRLSAIHEREYGVPLTTYKVLKVNTSHKQYQGKDKDSGLVDFDPRKMHIVRGHHAEYGTNGRGLHFGKYERKIWIPAHVRGNEEVGIAVKDYEVVDSSNQK